MIAGFHIGSELRRFARAKLTKVAIVAIVLMPLLYSSLYLWAFWDPFAKTDSLPIALVNSDEGTEVDGEELNAGDEVIAGLRDNESLNWTEMSAEEAKKGVSDGTYYFSLELPENFSKAVASPNTDHPEKARLLATYNDANGYLSGVIGENAMKQVLNSVSDNISAQAVDKVLVGVVNAGDGMARAADGAGQLADGSAELEDGAKQLDDGAGTLRDGLVTARDGSSQLVDGTGTLVTGVDKLKGGSSQLADGTRELNTQVQGAAGQLDELISGTAQLGDGVKQLGDGATEINGGVQELKGITNRVGDFQTEQAENISRAADALRGIDNPEVQKVVADLDAAAGLATSRGLAPGSELSTKISALADGTAQMQYQLADPSAPFRGGIDKLAAGTSALPPKVDELTTGVAALDDGAHTLDEGLGTAQGGVQRLADGATELHDGHIRLLDGATQLHDGTGQAVDGTTRLHDGASELHERLEDGARQVPDWNDDQRVHTAETLGGPVALEENNDSGNNTFGSGLAPFFMSLALFFGGIVAFVQLKPLQPRAVASGISAARAAFDGFLPTGLISVAQAAVVVAVTVFAVGLQPDSVLGLFGFAALVGVVYMLFNQAFIAALGPGPGKVIALAFLMLQMVSSGGLYPVETQAKPFQIMHPINPMSYAVDGFRQVIYGTYDERMPIAIVVLIGFGIAAFLLTTFAAHRQRQWNMERLHPALAG